MVEGRGRRGSGFAYNSKLDNRVEGQWAGDRENYYGVIKGIRTKTSVNDSVREDTCFGWKPDDASWQ